MQTKFTKKEEFMKIRARKTYSHIAVLFVACLMLSPTAPAVSPPPDGGYPGGNTAEGQNALFSLTTGGFNTAVGFLSLRSNTAGVLNTATGAGTLLANTGDENTATGAGALLTNSSGAENTANGAFALFSNTTGTVNTAVGMQALFSNTTGGNNMAGGAGALSSNTIGANNTANGIAALYHNTTGNLNTANGSSALFSNTTGAANIALGAFAGSSVTTANHVICIGTDGANVDNSCYIGNIRDAAVAADAEQVYVDSTGKLGTFLFSSHRFKTQIKPMERASEVIFALKPVTFRYKSEIEPGGKSQFGLVAEEVESVNPDLVVSDKEGKPYSVRYDQVNAMLLNEFLKEHRQVQEQKATIARLKQDLQSKISTQQKQIEALSASLQKVSAQIEVSKAAPKVVVNHP
jgi:Chaperone of endosialidase